MANSDRTERMLKRAYALGDDDSATQALYRDWAKTYNDSLMADLGYRSPGHIARLADSYVPEKTSRILDLGCGTGLGGQFLQKAGFSDLWGLDFSLEMLLQANSAKAYRQVILADLNQPLPFRHSTFDALTCLGTFTHGHVGPDCLQKLYGLLKPGGVLVCSVHMDLWQDGGFSEEFARLTAAGFSETLQQELHRLFRGDEEPNAWYMVFRALG